MGLIQDSLNNLLITGSNAARSLATIGGVKKTLGGVKSTAENIQEDVKSNIKPVEESVKNISRGIHNITRTREILERAKRISDARKINGSNALTSAQRLADLYEQKKGTVGAVRTRTDLIYSLKDLPSNEISWGRKGDVNV